MAAGSPRSVGINALEAAKRVSAKAAAVTLKSALDTAVTNGDFATARNKAEALVKAYGELAANRLP